MKKVRITGLVLAVALGAAMCFVLTGCGTSGSKDVSLQSTVSDSALITAGTLTVGVDTSQPPFASITTGDTNSDGKTSSNKIVGLDVDVAAELADELGLKLKVVDLADANANNSLKEKKVDMFMSATGTQNANGERSLVGPYLNNSPAIFGLNDGSSSTVKPDALKDAKVAAYKGSAAATTAVQYCSATNMTLSDSMKNMFQSLEDQSVQYVVADVVSGGYMSMLYNGVVCKGTFDGESGVYMAVLQSNSDLSQSLTKALQTIQKNGVLDVVISKWCGEASVNYALPQTTTN